MAKLLLVLTLVTGLSSCILHVGKNDCLDDGTTNTEVINASTTIRPYNNLLHNAASQYCRLESPNSSAPDPGINGGCSGVRDPNDSSTWPEYDSCIKICMVNQGIQLQDPLYTAPDPAYNPNPDWYSLGVNIPHNTDIRIAAEGSIQNCQPNPLLSSIGHPKSLNGDFPDRAEILEFDPSTGTNTKLTIQETKDNTIVSTFFSSNAPLAITSLMNGEAMSLDIYPETPVNLALNDYEDLKITIDGNDIWAMTHGEPITGYINSATEAIAVNGSRIWIENPMSGSPEIVTASKQKADGSASDPSFRWVIRGRFYGCNVADDVTNLEYIFRPASVGRPDISDVGSAVPTNGIVTSPAATDNYILYVRYIDSDGVYIDASSASLAGNSGSYDVSIAFGKPERQGALSRLAERTIERFMTIFYGHYDPGTGERANNGLVQGLYVGIVENTNFKQILIAALTIYVMFYGFALTLGVNSQNLSVSHYFATLLKFAIVIAIIQPNSWEFFTSYLFNIFIEGIHDAVEFFSVANLASFDTGSGIVYVPSNSDATPFGFVNNVYQYLFSPNTLTRLGALMFSSLLGFIYGIIIFVFAFKLLFIFAKMLIYYVFAMIAIAVLLIASPFYFIFLLLTQTENTFFQWFRELVHHALIPVMMLSSMALVFEIIRIVIMGTLNFEVCTICFLSPVLNFAEWVGNKIPVPLPNFSSFCLLKIYSIKQFEGFDLYRYAIMPVNFMDILMLLILMHVTASILSWSLKIAAAIPGTTSGAVERAAKGFIGFGKRASGYNMLKKAAGKAAGKAKKSAKRGVLRKMGMK